MERPAVTTDAAEHANARMQAMSAMKRPRSANVFRTATANNAATTAVANNAAHAQAHLSVMPVSAFLPCALIRLAKARSAERTAAAKSAEDAAVAKYAASTRHSVSPVIAVTESAEAMAAAESAEQEHALKDWVAVLKANVYHAPAKAKYAAETNAAKSAEQAADTTKCATKTRRDAIHAQLSHSKTLCRQLHQTRQTDFTTTLPNTLRTAAAIPRTTSRSECTTRPTITSR